MYSPKISEGLVPLIYREAKVIKRPMTKVVDRILRLQLTPVWLDTRNLQALLCGNKIRLDCGHQATPGHNLSNTVIIHSYGGRNIKTECHECGY